MTEANKTAAIRDGNSSDWINILQAELAKKEILLSLNNDIASVRDRKDVLKVIHPKIKQLFNTEDIFICVVDKFNHTLNPFLRVAGGKRFGSSEYEQIINSNFSIHDNFIAGILNSKAPVLCDLTKLNSTPGSPLYIQTSEKFGLTESLSKSLYHGDELIGVLTLWSENKNSFTQQHLDLMENIGDHISIVVTNILAIEELKKSENEKEILLNISKELTSVKERKDLLPILKNQFERLSFYNDIVIAKVDDGGKTFSRFVQNEEDKRIEDPRYAEMRDTHHPIPDGVFELALRSEKPVIFNVENLAKKPIALPYIQFIYENGIVEMVGISLRDGYKEIGVLFLFSPKRILFSDLQFNLAQGIGNQLGTVVANILANEKLKEQLDEINLYKEQLEEENVYLHQQVLKDQQYSEIVGSSSEIQKVFLAISQVSFSDSTVLILGETGTGKELVARAIHNSSPRKDRLLVKVNCAVIPPSLIESELFGHEKGSFTGALEKRIGKFELANNGTLFLDEIGEMPLELQVKLLRAIQEKEIERIGGKTSIKINVRIIAATNRDLQKEVNEVKFRQDLYYRLNVFPIILPPLRERKEDIPALVSYFLDKFSKTTGKKLNGISATAIKKMLAYDWPGNVRELEHLIERTLLTTTSKTIKELHLPQNNKLEIKNVLEHEYLKTHEENEREHIIRVLNKCNGKIYGSGGAAAVLNLRVSTLNSKINKLGIKKNKLYT